MLDPESAALAGGAGLALGAFLQGFLVRRQIERDFVSRSAFEQSQSAQGDRWEKYDRTLGEVVTRETLDLTLKPIRDEQEHRRRSMEDLGAAMARSERRMQRMELNVERIAAKLGVQTADGHTEDD